MKPYIPRMHLMCLTKVKYINGMFVFKDA